MLLLLDGSELAFVFIFGFAVDMWTQSVLMAPASMLVVQHLILWPVYLGNTATQQEALTFHIGQVIAVWAGSASGRFVSDMLEPQKLLYWGMSKCGAVTNVLLMCGVLVAAWTSVVSRIVLPAPWSSIPPLALTLVAYAVLLVVGYASFMAKYFPSRSSVRSFVGAACSVQMLILTAFGAIDYLFADRDDDRIIGFVLRVLIIICAVFITGCTRTVHHFRFQKETYPTAPAFEFEEWQRRGAHTPILHDTSDDEGEKSDEDYIEDVGNLGQAG